MKKGGVFIFLICILFLQFMSAETTFFEGDLGYGDDFIMRPIDDITVEGAGDAVCGDDVCGSEESCSTCPQDCGVCSGGGMNKELVCSILSDSLQEYIRINRDINYTPEDIEILRLEVREETGVFLSSNQVNVLVEDFEDECGSPIPLLGGFAAGRYSDLLSPSVLIMVGLVLVFFIFIYLVFRRLRNLKKRKSSKKKRKRRRK